MRVMIVSDTHGQLKYLEQALQQEGHIDRLLHLGDVGDQDDLIRAMAGCESEFVCGNNDFASDLPSEIITEVEDYRILMTHGHYYYVYSGIGRLVEAAYEKNVDIVMFGHIHEPVFEQYDDLIVLNPGSISYPRQEGRRPSYIMMETDEYGEAEFTIKYL